MPNNEKYNIIQQAIIIILLAIIIWDISFNKNIFNAYHLGLAILIVITVFNKFKLDNFNIKIPGLIEIAESNKEINKNIEKIINIKLNNKLSSEQNNKQETKLQSINIRTDTVNYNIDSDLPIKIETVNTKSGKINFNKNNN
ncbi:MAG: hypothetical protein KAI57_01325 [Candidatus Pacebacteria bacterium]|nr:hypothetical protein [Candidatus Paceibacterota bacterium]